MGQAWDKRVLEPFAPQMSVWKANKYLDLQAVRGATWTRADPFAFYHSHPAKREIKAGPHSTFLELRKLFLGKDGRYIRAADVFADSYGLLGLFHHNYSAPILPKHKRYISPEAVIENGRLEPVDPTSQGLELVAKAVNDSRPPSWRQFTKADHIIVALPEEVRFAAKDRFRYPDDPSGRPLSPSKLESWDEARTGYEALFLFDPERRVKSSVLVRSESIFAWESVLLDFPVPPLDTEERWPFWARILNEWLVDISPMLTFGEDGRLTPTLRCNTLLQAMYLMLWLDLIRGSELRECGCHDCASYYRVGPQTNSKYCSEKHAYRAAKRMQRGQIP